MARKKQSPTPWEIGIEIHEIDDGHHEITLGPKLCVETEDANPFTCAETLAGFRWVAGITARVALAVADDVHDAARQHRCHANLLAHCGINAPLDEIIDPASDFGSHAEVWIYVPTEDRKQWLDKVRDTLTRVLQAEQWQPSDADERAWSGVTDPPSLAVVPHRNTHPYRDDGSGHSCFCNLPVNHPIHEEESA